MDAHHVPSLLQQIIPRDDAGLLSSSLNLLEPVAKLAVAMELDVDVAAEASSVAKMTPTLLLSSLIGKMGSLDTASDIVNANKTLQKQIKAVTEANSVLKREVQEADMVLRRNETGHLSKTYNYQTYKEKTDQYLAGYKRDGEILADVGYSEALSDEALSARVRAVEDERQRQDGLQKMLLSYAKYPQDEPTLRAAILGIKAQLSDPVFTSFQNNN